MEAGFYAVLIFVAIRFLVDFSDPKRREEKELEEEENLRKKKRKTKKKKATQNSVGYYQSKTHFGRTDRTYSGSDAAKVNIKDNPYSFDKKEFSYDSNSMNPAANSAGGKLKRGGY